MIPKFNEKGYLPKGIHKATLNEIKQRFGRNSPKRKELFKGLQSLVQLLHKHQGTLKELLLNGSFATNKELPGDLDCILVVKEDFDFNSPEAEQLQNAKKLFNVHLFTFIEEDVIRYRKLADFFGHDRDGKPKGLVGVIL